MNWKTILSGGGKERKRTRDVEQQGLVVIQVEYIGERGLVVIIVQVYLGNIAE